MGFLLCGCGRAAGGGGWAGGGGGVGALGRRGGRGHTGPAATEEGAASEPRRRLSAWSRAVESCATVQPVISPDPRVRGSQPARSLLSASGRPVPPAPLGPWDPAFWSPAMERCSRCHRLLLLVPLLLGLSWAPARAGKKSPDAESSGVRLELLGSSAQGTAHAWGGASESDKGILGIKGPG